MVEEILRCQRELAEQYKYKKLPPMLSEEMRVKYKGAIPRNFCIEGENQCEILSKEGTLVATGYERIVIGDYGAFLEMSREQMVKSNVKCKKGQEYRYKDGRFRERVKYFWYTAKDSSDVNYPQDKHGGLYLIYTKY